MRSFKQGRAYKPSADIGLAQGIAYYERMVALAMQTRQKAQECTSPSRPQGGTVEHHAMDVAEEMVEYYETRLAAARKEQKNMAFQDVARRHGVTGMGDELPSSSVYT